MTVELTEDRAQRLLRWYPPVWRERYGEEFAELLAADLGHQPRSWRRTADVAVAGLVARLSSVGLGGGPMVRPQAALATVGAAIVGFVACGVSLWSQLLIGWRWSPPDGHAVTIGVLVMSVAVAYLSVLALLAAAPVLIAALRATRRGEGQRLIGAIVLIVVGAAVLMIGGHHVESGWPGATGHSWRFQQLVPGGLASFGWAETLGISAYWAHPSDLAALPTTELVWMVLSPTAAITTFIGAVRLVRRVALSPAALRHERRLATAAAAGMVPYLGAAAWWVISSYSGADDVFRAGSLDLVLIAGMAAALAVARTATRAIGGQSPVRT